MNYLLATLVSSVVSISPVKGNDSAIPTSPVAMKPAEVIRIDKPAYPDYARAYKMEGEVVVEVQVGEDGKATQINLVKEDHPVFNNAAITAAANADYAPATMQDKAVKSRVKIPFTFKNKR
ncbi:MAG: TonB family protein [Bacteroidetes bacterium]|nr:TonB family protein [Bacteroidota bacterium]MCW5894144.1 TonB family protein [Bacteroidota bacterium]